MRAPIAAEALGEEGSRLRLPVHVVVLLEAARSVGAVRVLRVLRTVERGYVVAHASLRVLLPPLLHV